MKFEFSDEQREFQRSLRELLAREKQDRAAKISQLMEGAELAPLDWILLMEEAGRAAFPGLAETFAKSDFDLNALAAAGELIGLGQHMLDLTVEYVKVRQQFGQPVGAFQAVKHLLANALLELELARPFVYRAAYEPNSLHISMAKAAASDAAHHCARAALQGHGAIGYSYEHDLHIWMKRTWSLEPAWGSAAWHRERIARQILDGEIDEPSLHR
jgi:alkylation response protein AidB-like acyl-CoA dehydrogenase